MKLLGNFKKDFSKDFHANLLRATTDIHSIPLTRLSTVHKEDQRNETLKKSPCTRKIETYEQFAQIYLTFQLTSQ